MATATAWRQLDRRCGEIIQYASDHGWEAERVPIPEEDAWCIQATRVDRHPDTGEERGYGFQMALGVNEDTGRVVVLALDGEPKQRVIVYLAEGDGPTRWWYGGAKQWRSALADPQNWTRT